MKPNRLAPAVIGAMALALSSCATVIEPSYQVDFRGMPLPVMLSEPSPDLKGRTVPISYTFSSSSTTSTYSNSYATVTVQTTRTSETAMPFANQLVMNIAPSDGYVYLRDLYLNYHIMMAPYYGENSRVLSAEAVVASKGALK